MDALEIAVSQLDVIDDAAVVLTALTTASVKTVVYRGEQTVAALDTAYGTAFAAGVALGFSTVIATLKAGNQEQQATGYLWEIYWDRFKSPGWDLSDDAIQTRLDALVPNVAQETVNLIKILGATYATPLAAVGYQGDTPTVDQVEATCVIVRTKRRSTVWVEYLKNEVLGNNGNGYSVEDLKAQITASKVPGEVA